MSFMHSMVFYFCKKGKRRYFPDEPQDYPAKRAAEVGKTNLPRPRSPSKSGKLPWAASPWSC